MLACIVLAPASKVDVPIELDYSSSAYWQRWWPGAAPHRYLDGSRGRDVLNVADRRPNGKSISTGFENAPGLDGGRMIQRCWSVFSNDYETGLLDSGVWVGFSVEQFASLQNVGAHFHPLDPRVTTIVPSRRFRYALHPLEMIAVVARKMRRARAAGVDKAIRALRRELARLKARTDDRPVVGDAPPHSSYVTILWSHDQRIAATQRSELARFLREQAAIEGSAFERCAVIGVQP